MDLISVIALVIALVSVGVAVWQGRISKQQLDLAKDTERRTEQTLAEIRNVTNETRQTVQDVKSSIDDRITKILDSRINAEQQSQASSAAFTKILVEGLGESLKKSIGGDKAG